MTATSSTHTSPNHPSFTPDDQLPAPNPNAAHINAAHHHHHHHHHDHPEQRVIYNKDGTKCINVVKKPILQTLDPHHLQDNMNHGSTHSTPSSSPKRNHADYIPTPPTTSAANPALAANNPAAKQKKKKKKSKQKKPAATSANDPAALASTHAFASTAGTVGYQDAEELDEADDPEDEFYSDDDNYDPEAPEIDMPGRKDSIPASASSGALASLAVTHAASNADLSGAKKKKKKKNKTAKPTFPATTTTATTPSSAPSARRPSSHQDQQHHHAHHPVDDHHVPAPMSTAAATVAAAPLPAHHAHHHPSTSSSNHHDHHAPPPHVSHRDAGAAGSSSSSHHHSSHSHRSVMRSGGGADNIWSANSNNHEERQKLREFWLQLGEDDRRSLVKVEKEAVLKKMKEQQKHSCSCSVCGRKRTAIEEELEILYDAYYEELEQYANHQQQHQQMYALPPQAMTSSSGRPPATSLPNGHHHDGVYDEDDEDDEDDDEDYADDEEEGDEDDEYEDEGSDRGSAGSRSNRSSMGKSVVGGAGAGAGPQGNEYFNFSNSLTVKGADPLLTAAFYNGGILTVADDLLKNDGKKFLDMMERLAERRMQREEEANAMDQPDYNNDDGYPDEDDDEYDEEEDQVVDPQQPRPKGVARLGDPMTEEQRMEEGRRMFQIFAARMFEQRVLQAYREKVAQERQQRLLEELQEEERQKAEREAKKLKEKEKKKDKKRQLKQQKEEERLAKEAAKLAEEAAVKAERERKLEEQRRKQEEERLRKEEERRQKEEERLRKEEEKRRRLKEEKDRELEKERKRKEKEERDRKEREDKLRRDREEKEEKARKEREAKEQKEREDRERREKEKAEKEKERLEKDRAAAAATAATTPKTPDRRKSWQVSGNPTSPAPAPAPAPVVNNNATRNQSPIQRSTNLAPVAAPVPSTDRKQSLGSAIPNPANAPSQTITRSPMWGPVPNVPMGQGQMPHLHAPPQPPQMYNGSPQQQFSTPPLHMPNLSNGMQNPYAQPAPPHLQPPQMPPGVVGSAGSPMNPAATLFHSMGPPTLPLGMGVQQQTMMHMQSPQLTQVRPPPMVSRGFNGMSGPGPLAGSGSPIPTSASSPISTLSILNGTPGMQNSGSNSPASMANQMMGRSLPPLGQAQQVGVGSALLNSQTLNLGTQMGPGANGIGMVGGLGSPHMGPGVSGSMPGPVVPSISTDKTNSPVVAPGAVGISNILPIGHSRRLSQQDQVGVGVSVSSKVITRPNPITPIGKPVSSRRESAGASAPLPGMERSTSTSVSKTASPPPGLSNLADSQPVGSSALDGEPILAEMNGGAGLNGVGMEKGLNGIGMQQQATHSFFSNSFFSASERDPLSPTSQVVAPPQGINRNWHSGMAGMPWLNNGWSGSALGDDPHGLNVAGRLFADVLPQHDRSAHIIDHAKTVYLKLEELSKYQQHHAHHHSYLVSPSFYTLPQMHRMFMDLYPDFPVDARELYDTCSQSGSGFTCTNYQGQGPMIRYEGNQGADVVRRPSLGVGMGMGPGVAGLGGVGVGMSLPSPIGPSTSQQTGSSNTLFGGMSL